MAYIESGGKDKRCAKRSTQFEEGREGDIIDVSRLLPNPHSKIKRYALPNNAAAIINHFVTMSPNKWNGLVAQGVETLEAGRPLRVKCGHGMHRSFALAEAIANRYKVKNHVRPEVVHLDRKDD